MKCSVCKEVDVKSGILCPECYDAIQNAIRKAKAAQIKAILEHDETEAMLMKLGHNQDEFSYKKSFQRILERERWRV